MDIGRKPVNQDKVLKGVTIRVCKLNGAWQEWIEGEAVADMVPMEDTATITVARMNNKDYTNYIQKQLITLGGSRRNRDVEKMDAIINRGIAKHVLKGWDGFRDDGKKLPYREKSAIQLMTDDPDFKAFVLEVADEQDRYVDEVVKEQAKN